MPHPHDRRFHHEHAHKLDDSDRRAWLPVDDVIATLRVAPGSVVADVGAGTGYFAIPLARAVAPSGVVHAIDAQPEMLAILAERAGDAPIARVHAEAERLPLESASCDAILVANVWHEIDGLDDAAREIARIARPGARLSIVDWRPDAPPSPGPPAEHRIAASDVAAFLRARGWRDVDARPLGAFVYVVTAIR